MKTVMIEHMIEKRKGKNVREADCCDFCVFKLECDDALESMICDDFEKGPFEKRVPGLPAMHLRDWKILSS